jgi:hypothetical protein
MNSEQRVAYINAQTACVNAIVSGMCSENMNRAVRGESPAYVEKDFLAVLSSHCVQHNDVISYLQGF